MKAALLSEFGGPDVLKIVDLDKPRPGMGQVLVEVHASSINPVDSGLRSGYLQKMFPLKLPAVLGWDLAGVVAEVGDGATRLKVGDRIYGQASLLAGGTGAFAEYAITSANVVSRMPRNLNFDQAAAISLVGLSALQGIKNHLQLQSGRKILIHGGAGGIGSAAIQIAKHIGALVATTATDRGIEFVKKLGVDKVIDYCSQAFEKEVSNYDAVFDNAGGDTYLKSFAVLKNGGVIVSMTQPPNAELMKKYGVTALLERTDTSTAALEALTALIEDGVLTVYIDQTFSLDQIREAFRAKEDGHPCGKIVIRVRD